jgi:Protein of unknown function (DUF736)
MPTCATSICDATAKTWPAVSWGGSACHHGCRWTASPALWLRRRRRLRAKCDRLSGTQPLTSPPRAHQGLSAVAGGGSSTERRHRSEASAAGAAGRPSHPRRPARCGRTRRHTSPAAARHQRRQRQIPARGTAGHAPETVPSDCSLRPSPSRPLFNTGPPQHGFVSPDRAGCGASPAVSSPQPLAVAFFPAAFAASSRIQKSRRLRSSALLQPGRKAGCGPAARRAIGGYEAAIGRPGHEEDLTMATIGTFKLIENGRFEGTLGTLTVRARLSIVPVSTKTSDDQPDYRVYAGRFRARPGDGRLPRRDPGELLYRQPVRLPLGLDPDLASAQETERRRAHRDAPRGPCLCGPQRFRPIWIINSGPLASRSPGCSASTATRPARRARRSRRGPGDRGQPVPRRSARARCDASGWTGR